MKTSSLLISAAGIAGLGALLMASPYFEASSKIMNFDGHCLRILERKQDDLTVEVPGRGTIQDFYFDVGQNAEKFATSFRVYTYVGSENSTKNENLLKAKKYCPSIINSSGLFEFVEKETVVNKSCDYE
jgi:hypothetical protein